MDPWTNPLPPQLSPQHSFISLPTFNNADYDHSALGLGVLRDVNDVEQHSHLSPTVHHHVNEQEWIVPERRSINYYLSDVTRHQSQHISHDNPHRHTFHEKDAQSDKYSQSMTVLSAINHPFIEDYDHASPERKRVQKPHYSSMYEHEPQSLNGDYHRYLNQEFLNSHSGKYQNEEKTNDSPSVVTSNSRINSNSDSDFKEYSSSNILSLPTCKVFACDRWTQTEKRQLIHSAEKMMQEGTFNIVMMAQRYVQDHSDRTFNSTYRFIQKLVREGLITSNGKIFEKRDSRAWTQYETNLLKRIILEAKDQKHLDMAQRFINESKEQKRGIQAVISQIRSIKRWL